MFILFSDGQRFLVKRLCTLIFFCLKFLVGIGNQLCEISFGGQFTVNIGNLFIYIIVVWKELCRVIVIGKRFFPC